MADYIKRPPIRNLAEVLATTGGIGLLPIMPGSWCSIVVALPALFVVSTLEQLQLAYAIAAVLFCVAGFWSVPRIQKEWGSDPSVVVIDEAIGMSIVFLFPAASSGWVMWCTSLFLFRLFDVRKPWPISVINNRTEAWAVLADDVVAALFTGIAVQLIATALMVLGIAVPPQIGW